MEDTRKYFDYELAYEMYDKVKKLMENGIENVKREFDIDYSTEDNGYIMVKDELNSYNAVVYLVDRNFDIDKEEDYYVSGEVDIYSYGGGDDDLYINNKFSIEYRIGLLLDYAKKNNYTINDYEKELESLEKTLEKIIM